MRSTQTYLDAFLFLDEIDMHITLHGVLIACIYTSAFVFTPAHGCEDFGFIER